MDLAKQPPRRPSNKAIAGIVCLARMTDKARAHEAELIGEYKYGEDSGMDCETLSFIGMGAEEFAETAADNDDAQLGGLMKDRIAGREPEVTAFNEEWLSREPQDDLHRRLLAERLAKYAPDRTDITTVIQSIELDDWGAFKDMDLTAGPPRTPYLRSVAGVAGAARMADKARAKVAGSIGDYKYGSDSGIDRIVLEFLGVGEDAFAEAAYANPNDDELTDWVRDHSDLGGARIAAPQIAAHNARLCARGLNTPDARDRFLQRRSEVAPERTDITAFFDLIDLDDELCFGIDLNRRAPRTPYDDSLGGLMGLARMIDKARAFNTGRLGLYWYGQDSGIDRRLLELFGLTQEAFAEAVAERDTDEAVIAWLGNRSDKFPSEKDAFNDVLINLCPSTDGQQAYLKSMIARYDSDRTEIKSFLAAGVLDDEITFARLKAKV